MQILGSGSAPGRTQQKTFKYMCFYLLSTYYVIVLRTISYPIFYQHNHFSATLLSFYRYRIRSSDNVSTALRSSQVIADGKLGFELALQGVKTHGIPSSFMKAPVLVSPGNRSWDGDWCTESSLGSIININNNERLMKAGLVIGRN